MKKIILSVFVFIFFVAFLSASVPKSDNFKLTSVVPKIFSPQESSNTANKVRFTYSYDGSAEISIKIFDVSGGIVCNNVLRESDTVMYWNGIDKDGGLVKSGIYIYQIEAGKNVVSGTVIVAK